MTKPTDDLEAVRTVTTALEGFEPTEQERIIRWAREKLGLAVAPAATVQKAEPEKAVQTETPVAAQPGVIKNLSTFVKEKGPRNDVQFAATVAYFHRFEAAPEKRKAEINADDLQDACRLVPRERFKSPGQTLRNAHKLGLLDRGGQEGSFSINSVGENLVAMALPSGVPGKNRAGKKRRPRKVAKAKKTGTKK
jgi:hypothetical protein